MGEHSHRTTAVLSAFVAGTMRVQRPLAQPIVWVFRDTIQPNLEVEMGAAGEAGHADETDGLTSLHGIAHLHRQRSRIVEVRVDRRFAPTVLYDDHHTVGTPGVARNGVFSLDDPTCLTGEDGRQATDRVIYACME